MLDSPIEQGLAPYVSIFPQAKKGLVKLSLAKKVGKARAGTYLFVENYCTLKDCDCRQVLLQVVDKKGTQVAVIDFFLDIDNPLAVPGLNSSLEQSVGAEGLLESFIDALSSDPDWYKGMCRRYRAVRKKIDGSAYQGVPFPKASLIGCLMDDSSCDVDGLSRRPEGFFSPGTSRRQESRVEPRQQNLFAEDLAGPELSVVMELVDMYRQRGSVGYDNHQERRQRLRSCLYRYESAADDLAELLIEFFVADDEEGLDAALLLLADVLDTLRTDLERQRPESSERMKHWQLTLARRIFAEGVAFELGAEVTRVLLDSRIEILPQLHQANSQRMLSGLEHGDMADFSPEQALDDSLSSLDELEVNSSFELVDALLQLFAIGEADVQIALCAHLFAAEKLLPRDAAVLMLFHPHADVREGVAEFLAQAEGRLFTPESLRRLIVARNWFPEMLRKKLDQAIANARRARVECAPLPQWIKMKVYASAVDGAGAQSVQIVVPEGRRGYLSCSIMLKKGFGVADAFLLSFQNKRKLKDFLEMMRQEVGGIEVATDYLDRRICQALADGSGEGKVPNHWLVAIAEQLGCDQWKAIPLDPYRELAILREELERKGGRFLTEPVCRKALKDSAHWFERKAFAHSWFEDDAEVDRKLEVVLRKKGRTDPMEPLNVLLEEVMEPRREIWLERLVLSTVWLKNAKKAPVPWEQMFHVAEAVADKALPLKKILLMVAIAEYSVGAYLDRLEESAEFM